MQKQKDKKSLSLRKELIINKLLWWLQLLMLDTKTKQDKVEKEVFGRLRDDLKVVNTNNKIMKKPQIKMPKSQETKLGFTNKVVPDSSPDNLNLAIPKNRSKRLYKFGYDDGRQEARKELIKEVEKIMKTIDEFYKCYKLNEGCDVDIDRELFLLKRLKQNLNKLFGKGK